MSSCMQQAELTDSGDPHDTVQAPDSIPGPEDHGFEIFSLYFIAILVIF